MSSRWYKGVTSAVVILLLGIASLVQPRPGWTAPLSAATDHARSKTVAQSPFASRALTRMPISFEANVGQVDSRAKFISRTPSYNLFLTSSGAVLLFEKRVEKDNGPDTGNTPSGQPSVKLPGGAYYSAVGLKLLGANPKPEISGVGKLPTISNYFIGSDSSQWHEGIPNYARVRYRGVYPGVEVFFGGEKGNLEYDFIVAPGASPGAIRLGFQGFDSIHLDSHGNLVLQLGLDQFVQRRPFLFQQSSEGRQPVQGRYTILGRNEVGFEVGEFDRSRPLYIDPVLSYATYLGGSVYDSSEAIAVDASGNSYITGWTNSTDFPSTSGVFDSSCGGSSSCGSNNSDIFVTKLSPDGSTVVYSTFIGGGSVDVAKGIAVDGLGNVYVVGYTTSTDYPTTSGTIQRTFGGAIDGVVTELGANGKALGFSTYLGGSGIDEGTAITLDSLGNVYVTGLTYSTDFPTGNSLQTASGGDADAFVTEINAAGSALVYSTYLGGSGYDRANGIAVDDQTNAYVTGITRSADFPTSNAVQPTCASCSTFGDAFMTEIQSGGVGLGYSTYLGGSQEDEGFAVTADGQGSAYMTGFSCSTNYPVTPGAFQSAINGSCDAVVTKLKPAGAGLAYSTYFGGGGLDFGQGITQMAGNAYITGQTYSTDLPLASAVQSTCGSSSCSAGTAFITEFKVDGSAPVFSTYLGGSSTDQGYGIGVDSVGNVYISGDTDSSDLPTSSNSAQRSFGGGRGDAWAARITLASAASLSPTSLTFGSQPVNTTSSSQPVSLTNPGTAPLLISSITTSGDFGQTNNCGSVLAAGSTCSINVTFTPTAGGTRNGTLTVGDNAATSPQTASLTGTGNDSGVNLLPSTLTFSSQVVGTSSSGQSVTLSNTLSTAVSISSIAITGTNSGDFLQSNNCGTSVAAGASCTISVTFKPTATGMRNANLTVTESSPSASQSATLTGTGISPYVTLSPTSLFLGDLTIGASSLPQTIMLSNSGSSSLSITGISLGGANPGDFAQTNDCGTSVAAGASCSINVTFTPSASGTRSATLSVADNAPGSPQTASLSGTGVAAGGGVITPVNTWTGTGSGTSVSVPVATTAGDDVFVAIAISTTSDTVVSVTDNANNTYERRRWNANGSSEVELWSARRAVAASSVTVTITGAANTAVVVTDYSGVGGYGGIYPDNGSSTGPYASTVTVAGGNWVVGAFAAAGKATYSNSTGILRGSAITNAGGNDVGAAIVDNVASGGTQGSKTAVGANLSSSETWCGVVMELQPVTPPSPAVQVVAGKDAKSGSKAYAEFTLANTAGNLIVAVVQYNSSNSVSSVTDDAGNSYTLAAGPTSDPGNSWKEAIYYATNIKAQPAPNRVQANFSGTVSLATIHIMEFAQQKGTAPVTAAASGTGTALSSGPATTANAPELLLGGGVVASGTVSAGSGYVPLVYASGILVEQKTVTSAGTYSGTETNSASANWTMQLAMFDSTSTNAPSAGVSPASLTFGNQPLNTTSAGQAVTLSNTGTAALTISGITVTGTNAGDFAQTNTCGSSVAAGANCTINVTFTPTATGTRTASVSIADDATGSPQTVGLTGTGVSGAPVVTSVSPASLSAGSSGTLTITGANFVAGATVSFSGPGRAPNVDSLTVVSSTEIDVAVTTYTNGPKQNRVCDVTVTNPDGSSGTLTGGFTVTYP